MYSIQLITHVHDYAVSEYRSAYVARLSFSEILFDPNKQGCIDSDAFTVVRVEGRSVLNMMTAQHSVRLSLSSLFG